MPARLLRLSLCCLSLATETFAQQTGPGILPGNRPPSATQTLVVSAATGDVIVATATNVVGSVPDVATGSVLVSGGVLGLPTWSPTPTLTSTTLSKVDGANNAVWATHNPTIAGTVGIAPGNVGGATWSAMYQPTRWTQGPGGEPIYIDDVWHLGMNLGTSGGRADLTRPTLALTYEGKFYGADATFGQEFHLEGVTADGLTQFRPMSFFAAWDGSVIAANFKADRFSVATKAGSGRLQWSEANKTLDLGASGAGNDVAIRFAQNNTSAIKQLNAGGSSYVDLLYLDGSNVATISAPLDVVAARVGQSFVTIQPTSANNNDRAINLPLPTLTGTLYALYASGSVTGQMAVLLENDAVAANAHAMLQLQVSGASGGDPYVYLTNGVTNWSLGLDNSDSDKFVLAAASSLSGGAVNRVAVDTTGNMVIAGQLSAASVRGTAVAFASLPSSPVEGMLVAVTNSSTNAWGAACDGAGALHVLCSYNGTAWTVAGK